MDYQFDPALRAINRLYGPMTPRTMSGVPEGEMSAGYLPTPGERALNALFTYGPMPAQLAVEIAKQPVRAGEAIGNALTDPTIGNITNAGLQTAGMVPTMRGLQAGVGAVGLGYGAAALNDSGLLSSSPASAAGLTPEQQARKTQLQQQIQKGQWKSGAERRSVEDELKGLRDVETAAATKANEAEIANRAEAERQRILAESEKTKQAQGEYGAAVSRAYDMAGQARARDNRFSGSALEDVYKKTGGPIPLAAAAAGATGIIARNHSPLRQWLEGTGAAFTVNNAPMGYDAVMAPVVNPEFEVASILARELPSGHPKKAEAQAEVERMLNLGQDRNPVSKQAWEQFTDPTLMAKRLGMSGVEGISALVGGQIPDFASRVGSAARRGVSNTMETLGGLPGDIVGGYYKRMGAAATERGSAAEAAQAARLLEQSALEVDRRLGAGMGGSGPVAQVAPPQQALPSPQPVNQLQPSVSAGSPSLGTSGSQPQQLTIPRDVKPRAEWEPFSADARSAVMRHVEGGGHLAPAKGASKDPGTLRAQDVHDQLNNPEFGVKNTQAAMKRLRDVVMANGVNPKTVTVEQIKGILDRLDPKIFGATIAAGGAGAIATGQDY